MPSQYKAKYSYLAWMHILLHVYKLKLFITKSTWLREPPHQLWVTEVGWIEVRVHGAVRVKQLVFLSFRHFIELSTVKKYRKWFNAADWWSPTAWLFTHFYFMCWIRYEHGAIVWRHDSISKLLNNIYFTTWEKKRKHRPFLRLCQAQRVESGHSRTLQLPIYAIGFMIQALSVQSSLSIQMNYSKSTVGLHLLSIIVNVPGHQSFISLHCIGSDVWHFVSGVAWMSSSLTLLSPQARGGGSR